MPTIGASEMNDRPRSTRRLHEHAEMRRRVFLQAGGLAALGLALPDLLACRAAGSASATPRAKACILLFMTGGPAQQETFDMKPNAPEAPRGEFRPIPTSVAGTQVC